MPGDANNMLQISYAQADDQELFIGDVLNPLAFNLPLGSYEMPEKRTAGAAVFNLGGNKRASVSMGRDLFVQKGDSWMPVKETGHIENGFYVFDRLADGVEVRFDLSAPRFTLSQNGYSYTMAFEGEAAGTPKGDNAIIYRLNDGALLRWIVDGSRVRKEIVVEKAEATKELMFTVELSPNMILTQQDSILLMSNKSGSGIFTTNAPHLTGMNRQKIDRAVNIKKSNGGYQFIYDETGLTFPYILDPSSGPNSPSNAENDSTVGFTPWQAEDDLGLAIAINDMVAAESYLTSGTTFESSVKVVKGGIVSGTDKSTGAAIPNDDTYLSYGGNTDLWGLSWTTADINATGFGVAFSVIDNTADDSNYLKATHFGFSIPDGATIDGIFAEISAEREASGTWVNHMRITVYYTAAGEGAVNIPVFPPWSLVLLVPGGWLMLRRLKKIDA